ncbi:regulatory protein, luxR family [Geodermatophilus telluris]|uniref:Regulatory protein, luxR family n=1 Tax=Geodermatophilus telluris TaxID=1190417 RepID=A0A1G6NSP4_9ACTN|nr:LuxR family transcriptional regulator [Geodermatophilus telluris]SDC70819.1 regulatory protein, luxR family [Geodermatophilus telluris]
MRLLEREEPLALLAAAARAAAGGRGSVVLVTGEPGIGKTALVGGLAGRLPGVRVLTGQCDDLTTPRPFGALRDVAGAVGGPLAEALADRAAPAVHDHLLAELAGPAPTVLVLEDVHWADDATVDAVRTVGRRVPALPAVLVLTYRDGEVDAGAPLRRALAVLPPRSVTRVPLVPLSRAAVAELVGERADRVHALTGGNPFLVTELAGAAADGVPPSVRDAVAGRVAALRPGARALVELVSVVPGRTGTDVLDAALPGWAAAAAEPERAGLLRVERGWVAFRHELARTAVADGLTAADRRRLHATVLAALQRLGADPADLVHHAEAAGDAAALAAAALPAARSAAAAGANREALAHFRRALPLAGSLPVAQRAALYEELAGTAYLAGRIPEAREAVDAATAAHRDTGDREGLGRCARVRSRLHWYAGDGAAAEREARAAVALLEPLGQTAELARACSVVGQLAMLAGRSEEALAWSGRAADLALRVGDRSTHAHALVNTGKVRATRDPDDTATLEQAFAAADAAGDAHEAVRALICWAWSELLWVRPAEARRAAERALAHARQHEVDALGEYAEVTLAWLRGRAGDWAAAERVARAQLDRGVTVNQILAKTVLAEIAVRRGDDDAATRLADVAAQAWATAEMQRIEPVLELEVEHALLHGAPMPVARVRRVDALARATDWAGWGGVRMTAWAAVAGCPVERRTRAAAPHRAVLAGDWRAAADAFGAVGWSYDRALCLSALDDPAALAEALETARLLGAAPLAARVARRMRALGLPVRHGRRGTTRAHPAGLTARQEQVLRLLAEGLTNAEIAARLVVSPRTAEHHVTAVLGRLGVDGRREAVRRAGELGLLSS